MRWRVIFRNIFSNWASYVVTATIGFLLSPFIVHVLGSTGYGIWTLVISLSGYFGLLDLGIRSSVGRFLARYIALNDDIKASRTLSTAFGILATGGTLALIATLIIVEFFFDSFHVTPAFHSPGRIALLITGLNMACVLPLGVFSSLLVALERYDIISGVMITCELARAALIVTVLKLGYGLPAIALIAFLINFSQYSAMAVFARKLHPAVRLNFSLIDRPTFKELFGFGIYRCIWMIANQLIFYSDSVVIGLFLSASAITYYAIAGSLINYGRTVISLVTDTFYPAATRLDAMQDRAGLRELLILGTRITLLIALPICLGFVFLGKQFIVLWMGKEYAVSWIYLVVLTIPQFTGMAQYVSALILASMAKHKALAYLVLAEGLANLIMSIILVRRIGLVGVAWGTAIPDVICTAVIIPWYTLGIVKLGVGEYLREAFLRPLLAVLPAAAIAYMFSVMPEAPSWPRFAAEIAAVCASVAVTGYFLCLNPEHRAVVQARLRRLVQKEAAVHEA